MQCNPFSDSFVIDTLCKMKAVIITSALYGNSRHPQGITTLRIASPLRKLICILRERANEATLHTWNKLLWGKSEVRKLFCVALIDEFPQVFLNQFKEEIRLLGII